MRKILFLGLLIFSMSLYAQDFPINEKTGKVCYEGVVKVDGVSASDLYVRANEWFAKTFNSANAVIQMQDKEAGKIIGKGNITAYNSIANVGVWDFTLSFASREGRYRYTLTNISHDKSGSKLTGSGGEIGNEKPACGTWHIPKRAWNTLKANANKEFIETTNDLVQYMSETNSEEDDW